MGSGVSDLKATQGRIREEPGYEKVELEWMRCTVKDVQTVLTELRTGQKLTGTHHETFPMRREQADAVERTFAYYQSIWAEDKKAVPRFLWNAKMRFGKTFTTYQLAKKVSAKRVLVVTFKPAVGECLAGDRHPILVHFGTESRSTVPGGGRGYLPFFESFSFLVVMAAHAEAATTPRPSVRRCGTGA